jgi:hypothetical protein
MFAVGEDENIWMLPPRLAPERLASVQGQDPCHSMPPIYIRQCLHMSGFLCLTLYLHYQTHSGYLGHDVYPPAIGWSIEIVIIGSVP